MLFVIVLSTVAMVIQAGVQVPDKCVMDFSDFKANVQGKDWITLYAWDDIQFGGPLKEHSSYTVVNNDDLLVQVNQWNQPDRSCEYFSYSGSLSEYGDKKDHAEFVGFGQTVVRYVSSNSSLYIMENTCQDGPTCSLSVNSIKVIDQRTDATCLSTGSSDIVLNKIPWNEIADNLKNCYEREFNDGQLPLVEWVWKGRTECPPLPAN